MNKPNEVTTPSALPKPVANNKSVVTGSTSTKSTKSVNSPKTSTKTTTTTTTTIIPKEEKKKEIPPVASSSPKSTPSISSTTLNGKAPKSTSASLSARLPFFASTRAKSPRKPIIETEVFDFEELYGSSTPKSSKSKHNKVTGEKQTKSDTKTKEKGKEALASPQQQEKKQENVAMTTTHVTADSSINADNNDNEEKKSSSKVMLFLFFYFLGRIK